KKIMPLKIFNTLSGRKEAFKPRSAKKVDFYVCGPTVYDYSHLGHARTYIAFDIIVKYLREKGYKVFYLQNITDIDDKIIERAKEKLTTPKLLAKTFEKEYLKDMKELKVDSVTEYARATDYIKEIISQIKHLSEKEYAYRIEDGIYYDISKFRNYGKLSGRTSGQAEDAVSRIDEGKKKRNRGDFCLWRFSKMTEPSWESPWDWGRPGWHIEDTAIAEKHFGSQYDVHGGARDLIFPHHEAEIAQMEGMSDKSPFVKYWMHSGFLTFRNQKMAKSLGNFILIRDFTKKYSARLLRFLITKTHYRSPIDYNEKLLSQARKELDRIDEFANKLSQVKLIKMKPQQILKEAEKKFEEAMADDFNTPKAVAAIFELVTKGNSLIAKNKLGGKEAKDILNFLKKADEIFNFIFWKKPKETIPQLVLNLVRDREKYRKEGNWQKADEARKKAQEMGYRIEDTKKGPKIKKI
ncbi:MAG: cysteine--tRNA ligase, partial [bacterium]|nr:cysteine--tRNA ligase [bacterium]